MSFEKGDYIVCNDNREVPKWLTGSKKYKALWVDENWVKIMGDARIVTMLKKNFKLHKVG